VSAARLYICSLKRGETTGNIEALIRFAYKRVDSERWAAHAAGSYITKLTAALNWLNLPVPNLRQATKTQWLAKALSRLRTSRGVRHRKPISTRQIKWAAGKMARQYGSEAGAALLYTAYFALLRTNELWELTDSEIRWRKQDHSSTWHMQIVIADKTHTARNREILVPVQPHWEKQAAALRRRCRDHRKQGLSEQPLITAVERRTIPQILKRIRRSPGGLRPGGNMFWLQAGMSQAMRHKQGGWTPSSQVPDKHYTRVSSKSANTLNDKARRWWNTTTGR